jgi:predicted O-methyltransferase YrrM
MIEDIFSYKLDNFLFPHIYQIKEPIILELGVQKGRSTKKFLELCNKNNGKLFSVDLDDCSSVSKDKKWKFFQTRDDNFDFIKSQIPNKIDVLFIDTLHEANHVKKLLYEYYPLLNSNGYIFIDDISHLPYLENKHRNNFYCEINNKETFETILSIYSENDKNFELNFSFFSSGLAVIKKLNENSLNTSNKLALRDYTFKNFLRLIWKKIKKN